jgi:hypothetical protein
MVIIKKEALSYFYTKGERRKNLVTKVSVIALRHHHRVTLIKPIFHRVYSQKNKAQTHHPQLFVLFSSSCYVMYFLDNFQTAHLNELLF